MLLTGFAVLVGLVIGLALPAVNHRFSRPRFRGLPLLAAGVIAQVVAASIDGGAGLALALAAYAALVAFALLNLHLSGTGVLAIGLALNATVIALNGAMPVHPQALVDAGVIRADEVGTITLKGHRHLEHGGDRLTFLDDRIPLPAGGQVVSFGDLVLAVAATDVVAHLARRRRRRIGAHAAPTIDLRERRMPARPPVRPAPEPSPAPARVLEEVHG